MPYLSERVPDGDRWRLVALVAVCALAGCSGSSTTSPPRSAVVARDIHAIRHLVAVRLPIERASCLDGDLGVKHDSLPFGG